MTSDALPLEEMRNRTLVTQLLTKVILSQQGQIERLAEIISILLDQPEIMQDQREQLRALLAEFRAPREPETEPKRDKAAAHLRVVQPDI